MDSSTEGLLLRCPVLAAAHISTWSSNTRLLYNLHLALPRLQDLRLPISGALIISAIGLYVLFRVRQWKRSRLPNNQAHRIPPVINIPADEIFACPQKAYESALKKHGPVIGVWRKKRLEYIVDEEYTKDILANNHDFSFERGTARILNLWFLIPLSKGRFFKDMHMMVAGGIIPRMERLVDQIFPTFKRSVKEMIAESQLSGKGVNLFAHVHRCIAEAMLVAALGEHYVNDLNLQITEETAHAIAVMTGIYQNTSPFARTFPTLWKAVTWARLVLEVIIFRYLRVILPIIWKEVRSRKHRPLGSTSDELDEEDRYDVNKPLIHYIARMYTDDQGHLSVFSTLWVSTFVLAFIFASVHQTAAVTVWVVFELSLRKEYIPVIREELSIVADNIDHSGIQRLSYESLRRTTVLDSFVREVLRTKGDTLSIIRETIRDVPLGEYTIPKNSLVCPLTSLTHRSQTTYGERASEFDPNLWAEGPSSSTVGQGYLPFGFGRWACPGRILAVSEIKMIVLALLATSTPEIEGGKYIVVDPLNVTSVPPVGRLLLRPIESKVEYEQK
ncbi:cytochrome P450 [Scleroderma citrinum]